MNKNKTKQNKTKQNKTKQNKTKQNIIKHKTTCIQNIWVCITRYYIPRTTKKVSIYT